ncbi:MAG: hypothetical protein JWP92_1848 [Caulobacter sp.]|nr:hypothetical protein [Caulobacter sp.]
MTAIACLRVFVGENLQFTHSEAMAALVAKVAGAYLETTWVWPRRYGLVAPFSFVLADPRATKLNPRELQALAKDLQFKLFGERGEGDIALMMFEGDQTDVMRFAGAHLADLTALLEGRDDGSLTGRVCKITPHSVESVVPQGGPVNGEPLLEMLASPPPPTTRAGYRGVFHVGREIFVGSVAVWRETESDFSPSAPSTGADGATPEHDLLTLQAGRDVVARMGVGVLFFPICFTSIVRASGRAALQPAFEALPRALRGQLAAAIYDTPRAPSFSALSQIRRFLDPYFSRVDLRVSDPAFQVDVLPSGLAESVTLTLPVADEGARLLAITRFMREAPAYRRKGVWQGVGDVRTRRELDACVKEGVPFLTGSAISDLLDEPVGASPCPTLNLPLHEWSRLDAAPPVSITA